MISDRAGVRIVVAAALFLAGWFGIYARVFPVLSAILKPITYALCAVINAALPPRPGTEKAYSEKNTTKPFFKCANASERKDWFSRTTPWNKVNAAVIDEVTAKLDGNPTMFEVFVQSSMKAGLVERYAQIDLNAPRGIYCTLLAAVLCQVGMQSAQVLLGFMESRRAGTPQNVGQDEAVQCGVFARDALEAAVLLDTNVLPAYLGLALLFHGNSELEQGLKYAKTGIAVARKMRQTPFHLSSIESVKNADEDFEKMERTLAEIVTEYEGRLAQST